MRAFVAVLLVGMCVADDKPAGPADFIKIKPENDWRLAQLTDAKPQKIGLLTYYPIKDGGYTFMEGKNILFYALPYAPTTYYTHTIGSVKVARGGQSIYRGTMRELTSGIYCREDSLLAKWTRDTPNGTFQFSIMAVDSNGMDVDSNTRVKLKSIVPVLERAEHVR